jgi:neurotransmitter-gated ion-channel
VDEVSPSWFPQVVLVNSAGSYDQEGVVMRVRPEGNVTLVEKVSAVAKTELNLRRFPFDKQRLEAVFEVLGFDKNEVTLVAGTKSSGGEIRIPQWRILGVTTSTRNRPAPDGSTRSALVTSIEVSREAFYVSRLVTMPLFVIVLLSFSVFWMDRASLGDRISVSFIGILSAVAYQLLMSEILPRIAYVTLMNGFLTFSFLTMVGTVVANLVVGTLDQQGKGALADRIDRRCRWIFPLVYFGLLLFAFGIAFFIF